MESYQETVLGAMKLSFFLIGSEIGEIPAGAQYFSYTVSYLESLLITVGQGQHIAPQKRCEQELWNITT